MRKIWVQILLYTCLNTWTKYIPIKGVGNFPLFDICNLEDKILKILEKKKKWAREEKKTERKKERKKNKQKGKRKR